MSSKHVLGRGDELAKIKCLRAKFQMLWVRLNRLNIYEFDIYVIEVIVHDFASRATLVKEDVKWVNDGLIEFVPKVLYRYSPRKSKGNRQFEKITTLNRPLIVSFKLFIYLNKICNDIMLHHD